MKWADWLLLALIAGWLLYILLRPRKRGCDSCCSQCGSCGKGGQKGCPSHKKSPKEETTDVP